MEKDIKEGRYLEHGEYDGNLYGTKIDSIHEVVDAGRTCILDVNPQVCWKCSRCAICYLFFGLDRTFFSSGPEGAEDC